jgi:hypothetical protein
MPPGFFGGIQDVEENGSRNERNNDEAELEQR